MRMHKAGEVWVPRTVSFSYPEILKWKKCVLGEAKRLQSVPARPPTHVLCLLSGASALRQCEQPLQCEISHQRGQDPVRYDLTGWLHKAKPNLSARDAPQILQQSKRWVRPGLGTGWGHSGCRGSFPTETMRSQ